MPSEKRATTPTRQVRDDSPPPPEPFGRLVSYEITGLFGQHDHAFDLEFDEPTILTGANGTGKSTILRTINAVGSGAWEQLYAVPFESLSLKFENAPRIRARRGADELSIEQGDESWAWTPAASRHLLTSRAYEQAALMEAELDERMRRDPAWLRRSEPARRMQENRMRMDLQRYLSRQFAGHDEMPEWVDNILGAFAVRFITDQRLVLYGDEHGRAAARRERGEDVRHAVAEYADDLRRRISRELARYAAASQGEDRAFPQLVVEAMSAGERVQMEELKNLLGVVGDRREALQQVGLLEQDEPSAPFEAGGLAKEAGPVIKTFAEVTIRKFDILEPFRRRLQLFVDFLDQHFVEKHAVTSGEQGLIFELAGGGTLQPTDLSSGEQQMLVLAYQLLFETSPGTLLLIDEPEISLHVGWQTSFVDDITAMGRDGGLQFLVASHSPVLIGGREELKRSLDKSPG